MKYAFIREHRQQYTAKRMCKVLSVSSSGYYDWCDRPESQRSRSNRGLITKIRCFHQASHRTYGSPRIHYDLQASGEAVSINRVARLMKQAGIQSKMAKRFVVTTDSKNTMQPASDQLKRQFKVKAPNRAWVSDTTFIATRQGWLYLAVILDLYSRQVIGWAMGNRNDRQLVSSALTMAVWRRGMVKQVIVHSDQGSTYASSDYQNLLKQHSLVCSMSRKGECLDNAVAESFFGTLKTEWVDDEDYKTKDEAKVSLFHYIEAFYNRRRRHSFLGYISPVEFEANSVS